MFSHEFVSLCDVFFILSVISLNLCNATVKKGVNIQGVIRDG